VGTATKRRLRLEEVVEQSAALPGDNLPYTALLSMTALSDFPT